MSARKLPEPELLRRLLDSGKLAQDEQTRVKRLLDALTSGSIARLEPADRVWAERLFYLHRIGPPRTNDLLIGKPSKIKEVIAALDALPRPKKPPGKR